ncbi:MAG: hypothetical protein GXP11_07875 [Gammaproteobacteria bacterium]|nr:hypothetical protein [Gammaproteobacteria bacterium]
MKWNYLFVGLIYLISGIASAAVININDPDTLVVDSAVSWNIIADTTYNYNNILITQNGLLDISGTSSMPGITLNSAGNIEIYGALTIKDVGLTLNTVDRFYLAGDITSNVNFTIQGAAVDLSPASSSITIAGSDSAVLLNAPDIKLVPFTSGNISLSSGKITLVPLPTSLWLMLSGLMVFSRSRFS